MLEQVNIEKVIVCACSQTENPDEEVSNEEVERDWLTMFFKYAGEISNEEMQTIWGALLAGEIKQPGSFSLRTLEALRCISNKEARLFNKISSFAIQNVSQTDRFHYIFNYHEELSKFDIAFADFMLLQEIGLLSQLSTMHTKAKEKLTAFAIYDKQLIFLQGNNAPVDFPIYKFTSIGEEILSIITSNSFYYEYFIDVLKALNRISGIIVSFAELVSDVNKDGVYSYLEPVTSIDSII